MQLNKNLSDKCFKNEGHDLDLTDCADSFVVFFCLQ